MQGAERREVVQATPAEGVANRAARPGVQMRYAKTPMAAEEAGRGAATLAMLAEKAQPAVQALHMQGMREDFLKGQMQLAQGKTYQQIRDSGASYATVSGAAALQAQKVMNDTYLEGLTAITQEDHRLTPEQYSEKLGAISKGLFTGDQIVDDFMTELASTNVLKLAEAQTLAHEEWKVQETKSAGRDTLISYSSLEDAESDKALTAMLGEQQDGKWMYTGPLQGLNEADRKEVILEAARLELSQGGRKILDKLGGMPGIRERFSTTLAEESAVIQAFSQFQADKENEYNAELHSEMFANERAVRSGSITLEQGLANGEVIARKFNKGNKTLQAMASDLHGAANVYMNKLDADRARALDAHARMLEKANEDYMKQAELIATADRAISTNSMYTLDAKEKAVAFQRIRQKIDADLLRDVRDGVVPPDGITKEAITRMATAIDRYGVVDDEQAAFSTAAFNTNLISNEKGEVYAGVMQAYLGLAPLYDINPALALKHLNTDQAKAMFLMARELDLSTDLNEGESLKQAAANSRRGIDMGAADSVFGTKGFNETMQDIALAAVEKMVPSLNPFTTTKRGSVNEISTWEMRRAVGKYEFLEDVTRRAKRHWMQNTGLTPTQAGELAAAEIQSKAAYVVGNILVPEGDDELHEVLGMSKYKTESGAPHEALVEFLKVNGPTLFGKQWFDSEIATRGSGAFMGYLGTKLSQTYRDVPELNVQLTKGRDGYTLFMQPRLNDGSFGASREVTATELGEFYEQWRETTIGKAPRVTPESVLSNIAQ
jgi:hypothetical protein